MKGAKRYYIDIDWSKMQVLHDKITASHVRCMKRKWNPFRDDWEQGFDSDCFGHCSETDYCFKAFFDDEELQGENHLKSIYIHIDETPRWQDEEINILVW